MLGHPVRVALLAIAAWALLFAPGAAAADAPDAPAEARAGHVAAAVLAPTFPDDSVARSPRTCAPSADDERAASDTISRLPGLDLDDAIGEATSRTRDRLWSPIEGASEPCTCLRGPPAS